MAFINWEDKYMVNVADIDKQHEGLFGILNSLHASLVNGEDKSMQSTILDDLIDYTVEHFATEEKLFLEIGFPDSENHKKEHDELTSKAVDIQNEFRNDNATISFELLDFLNDWLTTHTLGLDQEVGSFLNSKGIF
ncbi:bacteriohemerythrin [Maridesulfovibrio frigidus]|uniref:bacteriohemerythrin n=1 Tax=Maridesulfovibrio frigidus TaxID=340956 RepID=UPI0004E10C21|nr:bacteriohemerythrin [Maridesulfovibrio frigidus]